MTHEQIEHRWAKMSAREKDAEVAEAFGWACIGSHWTRPDGTLTPFPAQFTTTYGGMELVIAEMMKKGWDVDILITARQGCSAVFRHDTIPSRSTARADTAPEAVALAALKAVAETKE